MWGSRHPLGCFSVRKRTRRHRLINPWDFSDTGGMKSSVKAPVWIRGWGWVQSGEWSQVSDWNQRHFPWMNILSWRCNTSCASEGQVDLFLKSTIRLPKTPKGYTLYWLLLLGYFLLLTILHFSSLRGQLLVKKVQRFKFNAAGIRSCILWASC